MELASLFYKVVWGAVLRFLGSSFSRPFSFVQLLPYFMYSTHPEKIVLLYSFAGALEVSLQETRMSKYGSMIGYSLLLVSYTQIRLVYFTR